MSAAKSFRDSHPTWPWAVGLSGTTLGIGFTLMLVTLHSAERDLDILRKESNELVKSSLKQGLQLDHRGRQLDRLSDIVEDIKKKLP